MFNQSVGILGTGSYLPERRVLNDEIAPAFGVEPEWIARRTQIRERRYAEPGDAASDLAVRAAHVALERAGVPAERIDYIIVSTATADTPFPPTAALVQNALGARRAACFDINIGCSGFVYCIGLARAMAAVSPGSYALVLAAEVFSRFIDPADRGTSVLLADGAGAAVVGPVPASTGIIDVDLRTHGEAHDLLVIPAGGSRNPASPQTLAEGGHYLKMRGRDVTDFVLSNVPGAVGDLLDRTGVRPHQVDHFIPHQANGVMLETLVERCGLVKARTHLTLEQYGNVGSASVAITLDQAASSGALAEGDMVLLAGFGGGMALGNCLMRWSGPVAR
ncbi:3-oxoacyl-[acyl-carrier-protein] synthase-3 [Streptomyces sp. 3211.6]|uniref:3-oxoacyl-ACP synthase III family protein n=1 Tax=Streptomyces TaxID=1883 RepID=UPI0009A52DCA|nr:MULTISPECIES: ketoacyl-ACP synthase III [Streptomyces]RKT04569.1 3-oxoacyl-[acyl-carrier-protein] synthase-3 [Streptomyces sp. 3211.6]RPF40444.1 3-oxoacyl-[acyl-carrier-protein] synthase-3 [Streptomyces sp. Ag109_G2-6]